MRRNNALTLTEVMIALVCALVIVVGAIGYTYSCALNARIADVRTTGARLGLFLMEGWKASGADITLFDPAQFASPEIVIDNDNTVVPEGGLDQLLGNPKITVNSVSYFVKLTYDENQPQMLEVLITWNPDDYEQSTSTTGLGTHSQSLVLHGYTIY